MKLRIAREELVKRSVMVATPIYGAQPYGHFSNSLEAFMMTAEREGLIAGKSQIFNESLVPRARNYLAWEFLLSGMTHLLMADADIQFTPDDVFTLLVHADPASDKDVVCGAYPKKRIAWDRVRDAARAGFGSDDPEELAEFVGEFFFKPVHPNVPHDLDEPLEVEETGTGFMMIQRHVLERFIAAYPERWYHSDERDMHGKERRVYTSFFSEEIVDHRLLSEDFNFCRLVRDIGMKVWVCPRVNLGHVGFQIFRGNIAALNAAALATVKRGDE